MRFTHRIRFSAASRQKKRETVTTQRFIGRTSLAECELTTATENIYFSKRELMFVFVFDYYLPTKHGLQNLSRFFFSLFKIHITVLVLMYIC